MRQKKKPFSGVKVSEMLAAREAEKERINQVRGLALHLDVHLHIYLIIFSCRLLLSRRPNTRLHSTSNNLQCRKLTNIKHKTLRNQIQCKNCPRCWQWPLQRVLTNKTAISISLRRNNTVPSRWRRPRTWPREWSILHCCKERK